LKEFQDLETGKKIKTSDGLQHRQMALKITMTNSNVTIGDIIFASGAVKGNNPRKLFSF
jgi:hypothetical protein